MVAVVLTVLLEMFNVTCRTHSQTVAKIGSAVGYVQFGEEQIATDLSPPAESVSDWVGDPPLT